MTTAVRPFLMFEGKAEEAMQFYVSLLPDSRIIDIQRYGAEGPGPDALGDGGQTMMPLDNYGFSRLFTWLSDRYGVSWQLNLP